MPVTMSYPYRTVDVFAEHRFGGNPLAVLTDATGLTTEQMQSIAREFNYAESTFVVPAPDDAHDAEVRIFTPAEEIPFAGHPNIGTAHIVASMQHPRPDDTEIVLRFAEKAGTVVVTGRWKDGLPADLSLTAPVAWTQGQALAIDVAAPALSLSRDQIVSSHHAPVMASSGLPFLVVEIADSVAVDSARSQDAALIDCNHRTSSEGVLIYAHQPNGRIHARMLSPKHGIAEDPATGSAACALAGLLLSLTKSSQGEWIIDQGNAMGRPSILNARAWRDADGTIQTGVGGRAIDVMNGAIQV